jgi:hypothetical protein
MDDKDKKIEDLEKRVKELEKDKERHLSRIENVFFPHDIMHQPICGACRMDDPPTGRKGIPKDVLDHIEEIKKRRGF